MMIFREHTPDDPTPIVAAGALVKHRGKVALVRRNRYSGDVSLPKGKLKEGETVEAAAIREIDEEIGQRLEIEGYAGMTHYATARGAKVVFYFMMSTEQDKCLPRDSEVAEVVWSSPSKAIEMLSYPADRQLVRQLHRLEMI